MQLSACRSASVGSICVTRSPPHPARNRGRATVAADGSSSMHGMIIRVDALPPHTVPYFSNCSTRCPLAAYARLAVGQPRIPAWKHSSSGGSWGGQQTKENSCSGSSSSRLRSAWEGIVAIPPLPLTSVHAWWPRRLPLLLLPPRSAGLLCAPVEAGPGGAPAERGEPGTHGDVALPRRALGLACTAYPAGRRAHLGRRTECTQACKWRGAAACCARPSAPHSCSVCSGDCRFVSADRRSTAQASASCICIFQRCISSASDRCVIVARCGRCCAVIFSLFSTAVDSRGPGCGE